jgi:hypothetical protein
MGENAEMNSARQRERCPLHGMPGALPGLVVRGARLYSVATSNQMMTGDVHAPA